MDFNAFFFIIQDTSIMYILIKGKDRIDIKTAPLIFISFRYVLVKYKFLCYFFLLILLTNAFASTGKLQNKALNDDLSF